MGLFEHALSGLRKPNGQIRSWVFIWKHQVAPAFCLILLITLNGCAENPVTGKQELSLTPESMEIEMGEENYLPARQMQGGDYVVHPEVVKYVREVGQKLAALLGDKPAYSYYGNARKAAKKGNYRQASALLDRALEIQPREALFHLLKGDVLEHQYREHDALSEYRRAANLNPGYYQPHLRVGLLLDSMGRTRSACIALENSIKLLKTATALRRLGEYALRDGDYIQAKSYLKQATESDTEEGKAAFADCCELTCRAMRRPTWMQA